MRPIRYSGFTLLEMAIVLAIISILALMYLPTGKGRLYNARIKENLQLVEQYKPVIENYYKATKTFPAANADVGLPEPTKIKGNYLSSADIDGGAMHLEFGGKVGKELEGKILSIRPIFVPGSPASPVSWVCGFDEVPDGMLAAGTNKTDVEPVILPLECR